MPLPDSNKLRADLKALGEQAKLEGSALQSWVVSVEPKVTAALTTYAAAPSEVTWNSVRSLLGAASMRAARTSSTLSYAARKALTDTLIGFVRGLLTAL
jgi:hypothetical protein